MLYKGCKVLVEFATRLTFSCGVLWTMVPVMTSVFLLIAGGSRQCAKIVRPFDYVL